MIHLLALIVSFAAAAMADSPPAQTYEEWQLSRMNPIQAYMHKKSLDKKDWMRLIAIVLAYWLLRPYFNKFFSWWLSKEDGEIKSPAQVKLEHDLAKKDRERLQDIRVGGSKSKITIEASGSDAKLENSGVTNRKTKANGSTSNPLPTTNGDVKTGLTEEDLWKDEPARKKTEGDETDISKWLDRWDEVET